VAHSAEPGKQVHAGNIWESANKLMNACILPLMIHSVGQAVQGRIASTGFELRPEFSPASMLDY
jgi:hypothetical protein